MNLLSQRLAGAVGVREYVKSSFSQHDLNMTVELEPTIC